LGVLFIFLFFLLFILLGGGGGVDLSFVFFFPFSPLFFFLGVVLFWLGGKGSFSFPKEEGEVPPSSPRFPSSFFSFFWTRTRKKWGWKVVFFGLVLVFLPPFLFSFFFFFSSSSPFFIVVVQGKRKEGSSEPLSSPLFILLLSLLSNDLKREKRWEIFFVWPAYLPPFHFFYPLFLFFSHPMQLESGIVSLSRHLATGCQPGFGHLFTTKDGNSSPSLFLPLSPFPPFPPSGVLQVIRSRMNYKATPSDRQRETFSPPPPPSLLSFPWLRQCIMPPAPNQ